MQFKFLENGFKISIAQSINISALIKSEEYPDGETVSRRYSIISPSSIQVLLFEPRRMPFKLCLKCIGRINNFLEVEK